MANGVRPPARRITSAHPRARLATVAAALAGAFISGCVMIKPVGPDYVQPEVSIPDQWQAAAIHGLGDGSANIATWWTTFDDPTLNELIKRASEGNKDLKIAVARIREARAIYGAADSQWFPGVDAHGDVLQTQVSDAVPIRAAGTEREATITSIGLDSSWEIDFWGRIVRMVESAGAAVESSLENYRDVLVILYRDVALTYMELREIQTRVSLLSANSSRQSETMTLVTDHNTAGLVPELDLRQAELNLARTESKLPTLQSAALKKIHHLGILLGEEPTALMRLLSTGQALPTTESTVTFSAPAELLRQRPDIRRSERELAAQHARIGVARADLYPRFSLVGTFALEASSFSSLWGNEAIAYSIGPSLRWSIFNRGRIKGAILGEEARTEQALHAYENTVLNALSEVENAMADYAHELRRRQSLVRAAAAAARSVELVKELYRKGQTDFQNVFAMENLLSEQQDLLTESEGMIARHLIRIYSSLGGGWNPVTESGEYGNRNVIRGKVSTAGD